MKKYHVYTEEQLAWLKTAIVPSPSNKKEVEVFRASFVAEFSHLPDWTPVPSAATLVTKALQLQKGRVEFPPRVKTLIDGYLGDTLTPEVLREITEHASLIASFTYLESDILGRLEDLAKQAGGLDRPILALEPMPEPEPSISTFVEAPAAPKVVEEPLPKKEAPAKNKKVAWRIILNDEILWEGKEKPSIDITRSDKRKKFYLIVKDEILWSGNSKPAPWICQQY